MASSTVVDPADRLEDEVRAAVGQVAQRLDGRRPVVAGERARPSRRPPGRPSSLAATRSIATIRDAPASTAPITHDSPTPPSPMTATLAPAGTSAVLSTAPTPVDTQQPMSAATAGSTPSGSGDRGRLRARPSPRPSCRSRSSDRTASPRPRRAGPSRHRASGGGTTASPGRPTAGPPGRRGRRRTAPATTGRPAARRGGRSRPGPTASTTPAPSWPMTIGRRSRPVPVADVQVGVADARREDPDPDLAGARLGERQRLDPAGRRRRAGPRRGRAVGPGSRSRLADAPALGGRAGV